MRAALVIASKDLRQRIRDRSVFVIAVLVPFALAFILNAALGGAGEGSFTATYGVVDLDGGEVAQGFVAVLEGLDFVELVRPASPEQARRLADGGEIASAFVLPAGFSESVRGGRAAEIEVVGSPDAEIGTLIARSLAGSFAAELNSVGLSVATVLASGAGVPDAASVAALAEQAREVRAPVRLEQADTGSQVFSSGTFFSAGMAVFFVFFTVEFGVRSLLEERQEGTLARLLASPMRPAAIIAGKSLASFVMGLASMTVLVLASSALLGAEWGDPLGVVVLVVTAVFAAMGITALVATLARTPQQASSYSAAVSVVLGLLGGTFFPISQGPGILARISLLTPHAWLMRGFGELSGGASGPAAVLGPVAAVAAFGAVAGAISLVRARRLVASP